MNNELKVGIVVLVAIAVLGFFIIQIEDTGFFETEQDYRVTVTFDTVAGLSPDSPVRLAGVQVGRVDAIQLTPDGQARVSLRLRPDVQLRADAVATVASLGLLGDKYLELSAGSPDQPTVPSGGSIEGGAPVSIDQMVTVMNSIAANVEQTTESLNNVLGSEAGENRMQRILENFEQFSADLNVVIRANRDTAGATLENVEALTASLEESLPLVVEDMRTLVASLDSMVDANDERVGAAVEELRSVLESADRSAAQLEEIMTKVNRGDGTIGRLINEPETIDKANAALETIDDSLNSFQTFFNRVGQSQFSFALRSEFYENDQATKNYFGVRLGLGASGDRGFIFEVLDDNVGAPDVTEVVTEIFDADGELIDRTTERQVVRSQDFLVSAVLAQRVGAYQLRGGLVESQVGGGVDWFASQDRLRLSFDAWDFGRDPDPHLKLAARYNIFGRLFLTAGYDDLLNDEFRQFFFGGGYQFR